MEFLLANKSSLLFILGAGMIVVILMRRWQRYYTKQKPSTKGARRPAWKDCEADQRQPLLDAPPELIRWQVEMHETARDLKAEIDTKVAVLQRLVIDARQQADRLEAIVDRAQRQEA